MARPKKSPGRPATLQAPQVTGVNLSARERRIIALEQRKALDRHDSRPTMNSIIRRAVQQLDSQALQAEFRHDAEKTELLRRLELEARKRQEAEDRSARIAQKAAQAGSLHQEILRFLPQVKEWAEHRRATPSGHRALDQMWHNHHNSWALVLVRLEALQRRQTDRLHVDQVVDGRQRQLPDGPPRGAA